MRSFGILSRQGAENAEGAKDNTGGSVIDRCKEEWEIMKKSSHRGTEAL